MLKIERLDLSYTNKRLATISLKLAKGEQMALFGRSGTGKSTLLKGILQRHPAVTVMTNRIAYISQNPTLLPWKSSESNICIGSTLRAEPVDQKKLSQLVASLGLESNRYQNASTLSGGQRARVAIAQALYEDAELILLDEPFNGLDRATQITTKNLCKDVLKKTSIILVTHDPNDAIGWIEVCAFLNESGLSEQQSVDQFTDESKLIDTLANL